MNAVPSEMRGPAASARPGSRRALFARLRHGELEGIQVVVMLAVIWTIFALLNPRFLSAVNLTNLVLQIAAVGLISTGVVLVLLLGEIDLSIAAVSGLAAAVMAVLNVRHGVPAPVAMLAALATGLAIGALQGAIVTRFGVPAFVVTLAGLLGWQGAQLAVLGQAGTVNLGDELITGLTSTFLAPALGWLAALAIVLMAAGGAVAARARRRAAGLSVAPAVLTVARIGLIGVGVAVAVAVLNRDRGVPLAALLLLGAAASVNALARRTRFGRRIYAIGSNAEAARRAGISTRRVRVAVFALGSLLAAAGGIMAASRLLAVNQSSGGGDLLLLAIAGPVVAGTSLFGGRGSVWSALTGALVIGSVSNGMDLLGLESAVKYMVTGAVLLGAVMLDAGARGRGGADGAT